MLSLIKYSGILLLVVYSRIRDLCQNLWALNMFSYRAVSCLIQILASALRPEQAPTAETLFSCQNAVSTRFWSQWVLRYDCTHLGEHQILDVLKIYQRTENILKNKNDWFMSIQTWLWKKIINATNVFIKKTLPRPWRHLKKSFNGAYKISGCATAKPLTRTGTIRSMFVLFTKMTPKAKKKAPAPPKAKALKAEKAVIKGIHSHTEKRSACHPPSNGWRHCSSEGILSTLRRVSAGEANLITMSSSSSPWLPSQLWRR